MTFIRWQDPRPEWVEACRDVAPPSDRVSHLTVGWVPGTSEAPIQRWMIYECVPFKIACELPGIMGLDPESPDPVIRWTWQYVEDHDAVPFPCWIVQGSGGGHPVCWTAEEAVLAKAGMLSPLELPVVGDWPFAEPDARTWRALQQRSILRRRIQDPHEARMVARQMAAVQERAADLARTRESFAQEKREIARAVMDEAPVIDHAESRHVGGLVTDDDLARYVETGDLIHTR